MDVTDEELWASMHRIDTRHGALRNVAMISVNSVSAVDIPEVYALLDQGPDMRSSAHHSCGCGPAARGMLGEACAAGPPIIWITGGMPGCVMKPGMSCPAGACICRPWLLSCMRRITAAVCC